jgi:hypothetical protein
VRVLVIRAEEDWGDRERVLEAGAYFAITAAGSELTADKRRMSEIIILASLRPHTKLESGNGV